MKASDFAQLHSAWWIGIIAKITLTENMIAKFFLMKLYRMVRYRFGFDFLEYEFSYSSLIEIMIGGMDISTQSKKIPSDHLGELYCENYSSSLIDIIYIQR